MSAVLLTEPRPVPPRPELADLARNIVAALARRDLADISTHISARKGLLLAPYISVRSTGAGAGLTPREVANAWSARRVRDWGTEDGSGAPLRLSFQQYFHRFIMDRDFAAARHVVVSDAGSPPLPRHGSDVNELPDAFPHGVFVDFDIPDTAEKTGAGLVLVFERDAEAPAHWWLTGIVHYGWTI